jgi:uncharacterized membrane protein (UPF0127 family)
LSSFYAVASTNEKPLRGDSCGGDSKITLQGYGYGEGVIGALKKDDGTVVCARCEIADRPFKRMRGLLGRSSLAPDEGMLFRPAGSIHMFFMRFPIDAVFCDRDLVVVGIERELQPWKTARRKGAKVVIELASGAAAGLEVGDRLFLEPVATMEP